MQAQNIACELQVMYSAVYSIMNRIVPINCALTNASFNPYVELGSDVLSCIENLMIKIKRGSFDENCYDEFLEMKPYYNKFVSGSF